jgi:hypothetical protein
MRDTLQPNVKALVRRLIDSGVKCIMVTQRDKLAAEVCACGVFVYRLVRVHACIHTLRTHTRRC